MHRVLLVRHAIAQDRDEARAAGRVDELRPLTDKGTRRMRRVARALHRLVPDLVLIATSPLTRAVQTADLLAQACATPAPLHLAALSPERPESDLLEWLQRHAPAQGTLALVGHEPDLSRWAAWALTGNSEPLFALGKGGAALLAWREPDRAHLEWLLSPRQLRALA